MTPKLCPPLDILEVLLQIDRTAKLPACLPRGKQAPASKLYEDVSKSFRTGRLERELQMVQLSATRCSCIVILWVSLVSFDAISLCVASQRMFIIAVFSSLSTQSGNVWVHPCII
jgi:hypothetical protein